MLTWLDLVTPTWHYLNLWKTLWKGGAHWTHKLGIGRPLLYQWCGHVSHEITHWHSQRVDDNSRDVECLFVGFYLTLTVAQREGCNAAVSNRRESIGCRKGIGNWSVIGRSDSSLTGDLPMNWLFDTELNFKLPRSVFKHWLLSCKGRLGDVRDRETLRSASRKKSFSSWV